MKIVMGDEDMSGLKSSKSMSLQSSTADQGHEAADEEIQLL